MKSNNIKNHLTSYLFIRRNPVFLHFQAKYFYLLLILFCANANLFSQDFRLNYTGEQSITGIAEIQGTGEFIIQSEDQSVTRIDGNGNIVWTQTFPKSSTPGISDFRYETVAILGNRVMAIGSNSWRIMDLNGNLINSGDWILDNYLSQDYGGFPARVKEHDGNFYVVGGSFSTNSYNDWTSNSFITCFTPNGMENWTSILASSISISPTLHFKPTRIATDIVFRNNELIVSEMSMDINQDVTRIYHLDYSGNQAAVTWLVPTGHFNVHGMTDLENGQIGCVGTYKDPNSDPSNPVFQPLYFTYNTSTHEFFATRIYNNPSLNFSSIRRWNGENYLNGSIGSTHVVMKCNNFGTIYDGITISNTNMPGPHFQFAHFPRAQSFLVDSNEDLFIGSIDDESEPFLLKMEAFDEDICIDPSSMGSSFIQLNTWHSSSGLPSLTGRTFSDSQVPNSTATMHLECCIIDNEISGPTEICLDETGTFDIDIVNGPVSDVTWTITSGAGTMTYPNDYTMVFTPTQSGNHTILVEYTDEFGCPQEESYQFFVRGPIGFINLQNGDVFCASAPDNNGYIFDFTANYFSFPPHPNFYSNDPNLVVTQPSNGNVRLQATEPGNYTFYGNDFGCISEYSFTISAPEFQTPNVQNLCSQNCDGFIEVNVADPTGVTYSMDGITYQPSNQFTNLCAGTHEIYAMDQNGCIANSTVDILDGDFSFFGTVIDESFCGAHDGSITTTVVGNGAPFSYFWHPGGQTTPNLSNLEEGVYTLTISNSLGCSRQKSFQVEQGDLPVSINVNSNDDCNCDDQISAIVSGYNGQIDYLWTPGNLTTPSISNVCPGDYTLKLYWDNGNCIQTEGPTNISNGNGLLNMNNSFTDNACNNLCNGSIVSNMLNGTAPYNYSWSLPGTGATFPNQSSIINLCNGYYILDVTDQAGCSGTESFNIETTSSILMTCGIANSIPPGQTCTYNADVSNNGLALPITYTWSDNTGVIAVNTLYSYSDNISAPCGTQVDVLISDASGCTLTGSEVCGTPPIIITVSPIPTSGPFTVNFSEVVEIGVLKLYDSFGNLIRSLIVRNTIKEDLDISSLADGHYLLTFETRTDYDFKRIVKASN